MSAEDMCEEINSAGSVCDRIIQYNAETGLYETHICGLPFNDFFTESGAGFFIRCSGTVTWWQEGCDIGDPLYICLTESYNPIALPVWSTVGNAESFCQLLNDAGGSVDMIIRYRQEVGLYETHPCGLPFNNFAIDPGILYFIRSQDSACISISQPAP
jgi:hypothetical protein